MNTTGSSKELNLFETL